MTTEQKQILIVDLCARLPYGVICQVEIASGIRDIKLEPLNTTYLFEFGRTVWKDVKPYLRPMSSMTSEEREEFDDVLRNGPYGSDVDFFNKYHFDYRHFIEQGLALEATPDMYNI